MESILFWLWMASLAWVGWELGTAAVDWLWRRLT